MSIYKLDRDLGGRIVTIDEHEGRGTFIAGSSLSFVGPRRQIEEFRGDLDIEALANKLWEKIYSKPAIISCPYCKSHNAVTNPTCVQYGGPLGE